MAPAPNNSAMAYAARPVSANFQENLPGRYRWWVMGLAMAAFTLAFVGWLNETWLYLYESPIWLNRYTEAVIILLFGLWRISAEKNPYTRKRLIILVAVVTVFWWLIPSFIPTFEPYVGYLWSQPLFPSLHTPGTLSFFFVLILVTLFGRRIICGFGCPCVGIRETVGFAFRKSTIRGKWAWRLRHTKWFFFVWYVGVMVATQFPPNGWTTTLVGLFALTVGLTYFGSFFIIPLVGNRFYCRYLCPYGATFGLLNHAGFYGIEMDKGKCIDCRRCEQVCDMGIPVWRQGQTTGRVTGLEDCMGCARCVTGCPTDALAIRDVRNLFRPHLHQDGSHLLRRAPARPIPRQEVAHRAPEIRLNDWQTTEQSVAESLLQLQAERCLNCGVPGCRNACPLGNFIPDWLEAAAQGNWQQAGDLLHTTSPLPEVCGSICPQHRLCEGACTRGALEGAVTIGAVEQALAKKALNAGWQPKAPNRRNGKRVAVIGAGPAGLACAEALNHSGIEVTVYDRSNKIGGLLQTGVPPFKLDKSFLTRRYNLLQQAGINFQLGATIDEDHLNSLVEQNNAIFLGLGAQKPRQIELPGQQLPGVEQALRWLAKINAGEHKFLQGKSVWILGGGDTAMDCARSALRLGATVTIAYRGPKEHMRASPKEITLAEEEGATLLLNQQPLACIGETKLEQLVLQTAHGEQTVDCNLAILAFGQQPNPPTWLAVFSVAIETDGRIQIDTQGHTSHPKIWAGGDNTLGPDLAVTAMAAGRNAARDILKSFQVASCLRRLS